MLKYKQSVIEGKNLFEHNNIEEADYYNRFKKYETDRLVSAEQYANQNLDIEQLRRNSELALKMDQSKLNRAKKSLEQQRLLDKSIQEGKNLFEEADGI